MSDFVLDILDLMIFPFHFSSNLLVFVPFVFLVVGVLFNLVRRLMRLL